MATVRTWTSEERTRVHDAALGPEAQEAMRQRDEAIRVAHDRGVRLTDIAAATGLGKPRVHAILDR